MFPLSTRRFAAVFCMFGAVGFLIWAHRTWGRPFQEPAPNGEKPHPFVPTSAYETREMVGWTIHVNRELLKPESMLGASALALLERKLDAIVRAVPAPALQELRKVPIWLGVKDGHAPCSEYHPSAAWLRANGLNPDKAKSVEIGNASLFLEWSADQPSMVLHELSHAYNDRVLGFNNPEIKAAYQNAVNSGRYDKVPHGPNKQPRRAYALTDPHEFFAEASEAYFGTNDYFPYNRGDLEKFDPELCRLVQRLWENPGHVTPAGGNQESTSPKERSAQPSQ